MRIFWSALAVSSLALGGCGDLTGAALSSKEGEPGPEPARFAYLAPEQGYVQMPDGSTGRAFIDLRNGTRWVCNYSRCASDGRFPLEQTESEPAASTVLPRTGPEPATERPVRLEDRARDAQKQTVADIRNLGTAMFSWLTDQVGAAAAGQSQKPQVDLGAYPPISRGELAQLLVPQYIQEVPEVDGWRNSYETYLNVKNPLAQQVMAIRSPGEDGVYSSSSYTVDSFHPQELQEDIVWADGFFVRWPQAK